MPIHDWWDNRATRHQRAQALRMVGLSPKLAPLPWDKLTDTAREWLTQLILVGSTDEEDSVSDRLALPISPPTSPASARLPAPRVRDWWDTQATEEDHAVVLARLGLSSGFAGIPWPFLPPHVRALLTRRLRIS